MSRSVRPRAVRLNTAWVAVDDRQHLFAGNREGLISICGDARHPRERKKADTTVCCFRCMAQLKFITSTRWV